jgi:hypothetical protein
MRFLILKSVHSNLSILTIMASLSIGILIINDAAAQTCANIAGDWNVSETAVITCTFDGETETETLSETGTETIYQDGCTVAYDLPTEFGPITRTGTVSVDEVNFSGIAGIFPQCFLTQNNFSANGTIDVNIINLTSSSILTGTCDGASISCTVTSTATFSRENEPNPSPEINVGHAGAWFNPDTPGQGQLLDIEPESQFMFLSWFTFTDAASASPNEQHWFTAQGSYSDNAAELVIYETLGGQFDDPQPVSTDPVGEATLSFTDCERGQMNYTIDTWGLEGSFQLRRAIPGTENVCQERAGITTEPLDPNDGWDGSWFDEETSGQGFLIDAHPNSEGDDFIFVAWFTYGEDTASGQRWLTAQGPLVGSIADLIVYETTGGSFDDLKLAETNPVGSLTIDFTDCSNALLTYSLTDESLEGSIDIKRAIPGAEALCEELGLVPQIPLLSVASTSLNFGDTEVGASTNLSFTVTNDGDATLTGNDIAPSPFNIVSGASFSLESDESQVVTVRFNPLSPGIFTGNVSISSNGGDASVSLSGNGVGDPEPAGCEVVTAGPSSVIIYNDLSTGLDLNFVGFAFGALIRPGVCEEFGLPSGTVVLEFTQCIFEADDECEEFGPTITRSITLDAGEAFTLRIDENFF